jgi:hypothetical protein
MSRCMVASLIVAAALVGTIGWEVQSAFQSGDGDIPRHPAPSGLAASMLKPAPPDPVDAWVTTSLERPLLRETRRPDAVAGGVAQKGDGAARLAAVITGPSGNRAIFMVPGIAKPVVAKEGSQVSTLVVRSIEPGRVVVEASGGLSTYRPLFADRNPSVGPVASRTGLQPGVR